MTEQFFMTRADMESLATLLRRVPGIVADLAITMTRQDKVGDGGIRVAKGSDEQPLPINLAASDAHDLLHSTVISWTRHVCEYRSIVYAGPTDTARVALWLANHVTSLAMVEGCEETIDEVKYAISQCDSVCDRPRDPRWMQASIEVAAAARLNARGLEALAREMGGDWTGITRDRVRTLHKAGKIVPVAVDEGSDEQLMFEAGEVLVAHLTHPTRRRRAG